MFKYQILVEYEGTGYVGWQIQKNGLSVQEIIQKALKKLIKKKNYNLWIWKNRRRSPRNRTVGSL